MTDSTEHRIWSAMKRRCYNPNCPAFPDYGGRGISVCARWRKSFAAFYADMGPRPLGMTLDRIDNDGPYSPRNCRWASRVQQASNTRGNRLVTYGDEQMTMTEAARRAGLTLSAVHRRINRGVPERNWFAPPTPRALRRQDPLRR